MTNHSNENYATGGTIKVNTLTINNDDILPIDTVSKLNKLIQIIFSKIRRHE